MRKALLQWINPEQSYYNLCIYEMPEESNKALVQPQTAAAVEQFSQTPVFGTTGRDLNLKQANVMQNPLQTVEAATPQMSCFLAAVPHLQEIQSLQKMLHVHVIRSKEKGYIKRRDRERSVHQLELQEDRTNI